MNDILNGIVKLLQEAGFWARFLAGVGVWYLLALAVAHLIFSGGKDGERAAITGAWVAVFIVTVGAVCAAIFLWSSVPMAIALGLLVFLIPVIITVALGRRAVRG